MNACATHHECSALCSDAVEKLAAMILDIQVREAEGAQSKGESNSIVGPPMQNA